MVMFVEVINHADVKAGGGLAAGRATKHDGSSLVEYLAADGQLPGHLSLQPADRKTGSRD